MFGSLKSVIFILGKTKSYDRHIRNVPFFIDFKSILKNVTKYESEHSNDVFKSVEHTFHNGVVQ